MAKSGPTTTQQNQTYGTQTQRTTPWGGTGDIIGGLLGGINGVNANPSPNEDWALTALSQRGQAGNPFAGKIGGVADTLLSGGGASANAPIVQDAYNRVVSQLTPTASGDYTDPTKNPFFSQTTQTIGDDIQKRLDALYAGSGRAPSGAGGDYVQQLARGVSEGTAPVFSDVYNRERTNQLGAAGTLFGAGNTTANTLLGIGQAGVSNMEAGIPAAGAATNAEMWGPMQVLEAEATRRGIPLQTLATQLGLTLQPAQAFGTTTGNTSGTGTTTTQTQQPILNTVAGGLLGGVGLLGGTGAFGNSGWLQPAVRSWFNG